MGLKILKIKNRETIQGAIKESIAVLKSGGVIIHPTDTCYGITANIFDSEAIEKIYRFKGRNYSKPFSIVVNSIKEFKKYGEWLPEIESLLRENPKRVFSFVVPKKENIPPYLNPGITTIGIIITNHPFLSLLLKKIKQPLVATSANLSGLQNNYSINSLLKQIKNADVYPDLIIDQGRLPFRRPSSVVEIKNGQIYYLRK
jgi:L-threonylcarbamoyladenylate synthase